jgi:L-ascorbate metabolism protein UlaG (beta-lactamase superfamily)
VISKCNMLYKKIEAVVVIMSFLMSAPLTFAQAPSTERGAAAGGNAESNIRQQQTLVLPSAAQGVPLDTGSVTFVGTATVLIRYAGMTIMTDPNFLHKGDHVHLGYGLTSERLTNPAIDLDKLPPIDLIVLSHMHGDHFDQLVQQKLNRDIPIVTTPQAAQQLEPIGFKTCYPLQTWDSLLIKKGNASLRISATPGRHGPPIIAALLPQVMGSILEFTTADGKSNYRIYISGDTLVYNDIYEIPRRYPDVDLALLHLGGTRILGVVMVTMDGKQGVKMLQIIAPKHAIPIHYNDYDVFKSPLSDFEKEVKAAELQNKITYLKHGESYAFRLNKP